MITGSYVSQWSAEHPWAKDSYVEQDLVISRALERNLLDIELVLRCWRRFMLASCNHVPTVKEFVLNMEAKLKEQAYRLDTQEILRPGILFDPDAAWRLVSEKVISKF